MPSESIRISNRPTRRVFLWRPNFTSNNFPIGWGTTAEAFPTQSAEDGVVLRAVANNLGTNLRGYLKLFRPLPDFLNLFWNRSANDIVFGGGGTFDTRVSCSGTGDLTHRLNLHAIIEDFSLSDLTWNNQDSLSYEEFSSPLSPMFLFDSVAGGSTLIETQWCSPWGRFALDSGSLIYGMRIMFDNDDSYGANESALFKSAENSNRPPSLYWDAR